MGSPFGIFEMAISQYLGGRLGVLQPVEIVSTDGKFATVRPLLAHYDTTGKPIPINDDAHIPNIPVVQPFGKNGQFQFNPAPGDQGLLIACNWDTTNYKKTSSASMVGSGRQFSWSDGFFLPVSFQNSPAGALIKNGDSEIALDKNAIDVKTNTLNVDANTEHTGDITITGDVTITGNITVTGEITATQDITAGTTSLQTHIHSGGTIDGKTGAPI